MKLKSTVPTYIITKFVTVEINLLRRNCNAPNLHFKIVFPAKKFANSQHKLYEILK